MNRHEMAKINISTLVDDIEETRINLHPYYQRDPEQWVPEQQSLLIHSIMADYPIPPLYFFEREDGKKDVFDGVQRITAILNFVNGNLKLHKNTPDCNYRVMFRDGEHKGTLVLANKTYNELIDEYSYRLIDLVFDRKDVHYIDIQFCSEEEQKEIFLRLNNGTKMSTAQKIIAMSGKGNATAIKDIMTLPIFTQYACLYPSQMKKGEISNIVTILAMLCVDYPCSKLTSPAKIKEFTNAIKNKQVNINYTDIKDIFTEFGGYIDSQYKKIPNFNKWQVIIMSYCFYLLKQQGADVMKFAKWFPSFLEAENQNADYLNTKSMTKNLCKEKADYVISEFKKEYGGNMQ